MLNGIGGRTIAEAKRSMSYPEFLCWVAYRRKRGSLNLGLRIEAGTARIAVLLANTFSKQGGYRFYDFAPCHDEPALSLEQAMERWS